VIAGPSLKAAARAKQHGGDLTNVGLIIIVWDAISAPMVAASRTRCIR